MTLAWLALGADFILFALRLSDSCQTSKGCVGHERDLVQMQDTVTLLGVTRSLFG